MACYHQLFIISQLLVCRSVSSLLAPSTSQRITVSKLLSTQTDTQEESELTRRSAIDQINLNNQLVSYSFHWDSLLTKEYQDTVSELQQRRKSYTRSQLEASGLALFNAVATPETELYGEKIIRISLFQQPQKYDRKGGGEKLREKFKRGDVLVMTPEIQFRGKDIAPREGVLVLLSWKIIHLHPTHFSPSIRPRHGCW